MVVWLKDMTRVVVEDAFIAGIWDDELVVSRDGRGAGLDFDVARSIPLADIRRVEVVTLDGTDKDEKSDSSWSLGWGEHR